MRILRNEFNLDKADIGANASRMNAVSSNMAPMLSATTIGKAEFDRLTHEISAIERLCKVFGLDGKAVIAEMKDYGKATNNDWRACAKWARALIQQKPERLRV